MAINVDTVYKTVLLILNKEQRGYITPDEFNRTGTQVQLDIFEQYFDDLNQQLRVPQSDYDYSDRQMSIDEKLSPFKTEGDCTYNAGKFDLPTIPVNAAPTIIYDGAIPTSTRSCWFKSSKYCSNISSCTCVPVLLNSSGVIYPRCSLFSINKTVLYTVSTFIAIFIFIII